MVASKIKVFLLLLKEESPKSKTLLNLEPLRYKIEKSI